MSKERAVRELVTPRSGRLARACSPPAPSAAFPIVDLARALILLLRYPARTNPTVLSARRSRSLEGTGRTPACGGS